MCSIKKHIIGMIALAMVISFSCKKKDKDPAPATTTTTAPLYTAPSAILQSYYSYIDNLNVVTLDSTVFAVFYESPLGSTPTLTYVSAGNVIFNNSTLVNVFGMYSNSVAISISDSIKWNVAGSGTITPFNYSYKASYPQYTGGNLLPDTCIKTNGITLNISGVSNLQKGVSVFVQQSSLMVTKYLAAGNGLVTFSAAELASFSINSPINFQINFTNNRIELFGGVYQQFNNTVLYNKISYLK